MVVICMCICAYRHMHIQRDVLACVYWYFISWPSSKAPGPSPPPPPPRRPPRYKSSCWCAGAVVWTAEGERDGASYCVSVGPRHIDGYDMLGGQVSLPSGLNAQQDKRQTAWVSLTNTKKKEKKKPCVKVWRVVYTHLVSKLIVCL